MVRNGSGQAGSNESFRHLIHILLDQETESLGWNKDLAITN